ncbi:zinc finger MYM-type protein 1-like [Tripterygium wilfordii]|uniref:zinc finger MYM-type protein 1-like n=1 Tax=Tripterygium wilfordii TaxID=458696 RepID=UPI0018F84D14|nr:zinc finger MYM-type protein 1-like [Tripterygium wilfordii]
MENQGRKKGKTIISFFNKKRGEETSTSVDIPMTTTESQPHAKVPRIAFDENDLERDPGLRIPIWSHPVYNKDEVRRAYIKWGPNQPVLANYPRTKSGGQNQRFQQSWFIKFPWLEYSISKDAAFCFPCFVFQDREPLHPAFTVNGFNSWKRVNNGAKCVFLAHMGGPTSPHNNAVRNVEALKNISRHIDKVMNVQSLENVKKNRLCLKTTIDSVRWLTLQGCALRGHDESLTSKNRGNLVELISLMGKLNVEIDDVVLEKAPGNAKYTSHLIQKDILHILSTKVRNKIREEVGNARFCILVDEAKDVSNREQMAIILRFVDIHGYLQERFFEIVHVEDTCALTLKNQISQVLTRHNLHIKDLRGQGYDGASNMRGAWNGLQVLFRSDCEYAYYVHCFAHRLQLALVAAAEKEISVWLFFSKLTCIVNLVSASPKRYTELRSTQASEIECDIASGERETGKGANQIGTLHRAGTTRWSSHFDSICSLIDMYGATIIVLRSLVKEGATNKICGEVGGCLMSM